MGELVGGTYERFLFIGFMYGCQESPVNTPQVNTSEQDDNMISLRIDFGESSETDWFIVNDDVMGGVSTSETQVTASSLIFSRSFNGQQWRFCFFTQS